MAPLTRSELAASWRAKADQMDTTAKAYNRRCVAVKGVQLILLAKQLRECAEQIEALPDGQTDKPEATGIDAQSQADGK